MINLEKETIKEIVAQKKKMQCRLRVMKDKERIEGSVELTFVEVIGEKLSELMKDAHVRVQEAQQILRRIKRNPH